MVKVLDSQSRGPVVQNHWVALKSTQPFILPRSIKCVPGIPGNLVVKSKLPVIKHLMNIHMLNIHFKRLWTQSSVKDAKKKKNNNRDGVIRKKRKSRNQIFLRGWSITITDAIEVEIHIQMWIWRREKNENCEIIF